MEPAVQEEKIHDLEQAMQTLLIRVDDNEKDIVKNYVSYKQFMWTVGILTSVVAGMFYLIYSRQEQIQVQMADLIKNSSETKSDVSFIKGKLSQ